MMKRFYGLESKYVADVLNNSCRTSKNGAMVQLFENELKKATNAEFAVAMCNGTATLHTCLLAAEIEPGDEVITTPLTMSATSFAIMQAGAVPVFADVDPHTWNITPETVARRITRRTKAVMPVALYGHPIDRRIKDVCKSYGLVLIEDAAQRSPGATVADMASFSYQASKHLTSGEGGAVITNNQRFADNLRRFSSLGYAGVSSTQARIKRSDIQNPNYSRHVSMGWNYRMSDICAAVLLGQIQNRFELCAGRDMAARNFRAEKIPFLIPQADNYEHSNWAFAAALNGVSWDYFYDEFVRRGGDPPYSAWKLTYQEPFWGGRKFDACPVAEDLQRRIVAFCTNYSDFATVAKQVDILIDIKEVLDKQVTAV